MISDYYMNDHVRAMEDRIEELEDDSRTFDSVIEELHGIEDFMAPGEYARFLEASPTIREVIS